MTSKFRFITFPAVSILLCVALCACGSSDNNQKSKYNPSPGTIETSQTKEGAGKEKTPIETGKYLPLPFPIAFTSSRDSNEEIYITLNAGSPGINISNHATDDDSFIPYRDGGVFVSQRDGDHDIFYVHYDTKLVFENLTKNPATEKQLAVSPNLKELLFTSNRDGDMDIFFYMREGFPPRNVTRNEASDEMPVWMPDGKQFLFESNREGDYDIYIQPVEGGPAKNITDSKSDDRFPSVSPDGKLLAFESDRDGITKIYLYRFDDKSVQCFSGETYNDNTPIFSHDGKYLAYNHSVEDFKISKIIVRELVGKGTIDVTDYEKSCAVSGFSPDDKWLMYVSKRTGNLDIFIFNLETKETVNVTSHPGSDYYPVFLPSKDSPFIKAILEMKSSS